MEIFEKEGDRINMKIIGFNQEKDKLIVQLRDPNHEMIIIEIMNLKKKEKIWFFLYCQNIFDLAKNSLFKLICVDR